MNFLANIKISHRLIGNAVIIGLSLLIMFILMISNGNHLVDLSRSLKEVETLDKKVLTLRRNEKDFLARKDLKYVDKFEKNFSSLNQTVQKLIEVLNAADLDASQVVQFGRISKDYLTQFQSMVELQKQIGLHPKDGYYGDLRAAVHEVETLLKQQNNYELLTYMLQLRRAEKDFMLRRDAKYLDKFNNNLSTFNQRLSASPLASGYKSSVADKLAIYQQKFGALVDAEKQIGLDHKSGQLGKLRETIHETETLLGKLVTDVENEIEDQLSSSAVTGTIVFLAAIGIVLAIVIMTTLSITRPLKQVSAVMLHIRKNDDLTVKVPVEGDNEIATLSRDFNALTDAFEELIHNVKETLKTLDQATQEMARNANETSIGMDQQFTESDMVATSGAEMQATVGNINDNSQMAVDAAQSTQTLANQGSKEVNRTVDNIVTLAQQLQDALTQIEKLKNDSQSIGIVSESIRGIAEQTNLLALNAAIEAARAGEQGRGFAVVADEVRSLAMRTQESTSEIESIISSLQQSTTAIVDVVDICHKTGMTSSEQAKEAGEALNKIAQEVDSVVDMNTQISTAIAEQDTVATAMSEHIVKIRDIAERSKESANVNAQTSEEIAQQSANLHRFIERFKTACS